MKILYFTDTHIRNTTPRNRVDDYPEAIYAKVCEVLLTAKEHGVNVILHGGDIFDRPDVPPWLVREYALIFKESGIPIYIIAGNHDTYGQNTDTIEHTMLGLLDGLEILHIIKPGQKTFISDKGLTLQITGQHYFYNIDVENIEKSYVVNEKSADFAVHLVHGMLLHKPFFTGMAYTLIENITKTSADITFAGHYHSGFEPVKINGKFFINPGSIARINNSILELKRIPQCVIADIGQTGLDIDFIKLKCAVPGDEVFDKHFMEVSALNERKVAEFIQRLRICGKYNMFDINDIIEKTASLKGFDEAVKAEALERLKSVINGKR
jgi:exonuclease SbcD